MAKRRVLLVGGGIAGVETALTLALGSDDLEVTMLGQWPSMRMLPNLVYVPFGMSPHRLDVSLAEALEPYGIKFLEGLVERVDLGDRRVYLDNAETMTYDVLVLAPGVNAFLGSTHHLRTLDNALLLRDALESLSPSDHRHARSITLRLAVDNAWTPPAYEFALLAAKWLAVTGKSAFADVVLVTGEMQPFNIFGMNSSEIVQKYLADAGVSIVSGVQQERVDEITGDVTVDFDLLDARRVRGVQHFTDAGFYDCDEHGAIEENVYVVGDAANISYKAAFATSWQARRVLRHLGGSVERIAEKVPGMKVGTCEYQMDLGDETLVVRIDTTANFTNPFLGNRAQTEVRPGAPDKLAGLLLRDLLLKDHYDMQIAHRFHDYLRSLEGAATRN